MSHAAARTLDGEDPVDIPGVPAGPQNVFVYQFGPFELRPEEQLLLRDGIPVGLSYRVFALLLILIEHSGYLVEKTELLSKVWQDSFVEEGNLTVSISSLRKALGDPRNEQRYIKTVPGHGYRFVGKVRKLVRTKDESPQSKKIQDAPSASISFRPHLNRWQKFTFVSLGALAILLSGSGIVRLETRFRSSMHTAPQIHSLAVVPFQNAIPDPEFAKMSVEITDDVISRLSEHGTIAVRPTASVLRYVDRSVDPIAAGREQKVDAVLIGTIAEHEGKVRLSAQLLRVKDGSLVWQGTFDSPLNQTSDLEEQLLEGVEQTIFLEKPAVRTNTAGTTDPEARRFYLEGRYFWNKKSEEGIRRSIEDFKAATMKDPRYALAYVGLADAYAALAIYNFESAQEAYPLAEAAARKALALDNTLPEPHSTLGGIAFNYEWNWSKGEQELRHAIQLNPSLSAPHAWYALDLAAAGRLDPALKEALLAEDLDPVSPATVGAVCQVYYLRREYDQSVAKCLHVIDLDSQYPTVYYRLGKAYLMQRKYTDAIRELRQAKQLFGHDLELDGLIGYTEAASGNAAAARLTLADLIQRSDRGFDAAYAIAVIYVALGDHAHALEWLSKCRQDRAASIVIARVDPLFDPMRSDPRFSSLLTEMGLAPIATHGIPGPTQ